MKAKWKRAATMALALGLLSPMVMGASLFLWTGDGDGVSWEDYENWDQTCPPPPEACNPTAFPGQYSTGDDVRLVPGNNFTLDIVTETIDFLKVGTLPGAGQTTITVTSDGSGANTLTCDRLVIDANNTLVRLRINDLATIQTVE